MVALTRLRNKTDRPVKKNRVFGQSLGFVWQAATAAVWIATAAVWIATSPVCTLNAIAQTKTHPFDASAKQIDKQGVTGVDSAYSHLTKAKALYQSNSYRAAGLEYQKSLALKSTPEAYIGLGKVAEKLEGSGAGKSDFLKAVSIDPNSVVAHRELGIYCLNNRELTRANSELSMALNLDRTDSVICAITCFSKAKFKLLKMR
jgi:tetratricopeptide (TPR) repeat protein